MKAELDPKFLRNFSTDYKYNELNDEQKEVHDALFHADEEYDLEEDLPENEEENELDMIISMAKGDQKREVKEQGKQEKIVRFDIGDEEGDEEWGDEEDGEEDQGEEEEGLDIDEEEIEFLEKTRKKDRNEELAKNEPVFTDDDFPPIAVLDGLIEEEMEGEEKKGNKKVHMNMDEDDEKLEKQVVAEQELENRFSEVLKNEYGALDDKASKTISQGEFDQILNEHISSLGGKKGILKVKEAKQKKNEPRVETVNVKGGGQVVFYFGGAKPDSSKPKKEVKNSVEKALIAEHQHPPEFLAKMKELEATRAQRIKGVNLEQSSGDEEWDDDEGGEEGEGEEEGGEGEEEGNEYDEDDELGINREVDDVIDIKIKKLRLDRNLPLDERIERDALLLPDSINGLKVFKKVLLPVIPFSQDIAAQQSLAEEEEIDFSKPPTEFDSKSIREPIVEFDYRPKTLTKEQALGGATVVKETRVGKKKRSSKKALIIKKGIESDKKRKEAEADHSMEEEHKKLESIVRHKDETEEEKKLRKELVKKNKDARKLKKKNFKEKYEQMKRGAIGQINSHTGGTQGVSVYRID